MSLLLSQQGWSANSALVEGADTLAAQVSPIVAASSTAIEGPDVLQAQVSPVVAVAATATEGADVLAASVQIVVGLDVSAALNEGADVLVASVSVLSALDFSVAADEGPDLLAAAIAVPTKVGGDDVPRVEIWSTRKAKAVRQRVKRELVALRTVAPELAEAIAVPAPQPDWAAYIAQLQAVAAKLEALQADWLEQDDEEILLLLT